MPENHKYLDTVTGRLSIITAMRNMFDLMSGNPLSDDAVIEKYQQMIDCEDAGKNPINEGIVRTWPSIRFSSEFAGIAATESVVGEVNGHADMVMSSINYVQESIKIGLVTTALNDELSLDVNNWDMNAMTQFGDEIIHESTQKNEPQPAFTPYT